MTIAKELMNIKKKTGVSARHIGDLVDPPVTSNTVWNWLMGRTEPSASQMDIIRKFFNDHENAA